MVIMQYADTGQLSCRRDQQIGNFHAAMVAPLDELFLHVQPARALFR